MKTNFTYDALAVGLNQIPAEGQGVLLAKLRSGHDFVFDGKVVDTATGFGWPMFEALPEVEHKAIHDRKPIKHYIWAEAMETAWKAITGKFFNLNPVVNVINDLDVTASMYTVELGKHGRAGCILTLEELAKEREANVTRTDP